MELQFFLQMYLCLVTEGNPSILYGIDENKSIIEQVRKS